MVSTVKVIITTIIIIISSINTIIISMRLMCPSTGAKVYRYHSKK